MSLLENGSRNCNEDYTQEHNLFCIRFWCTAHLISGQRLTVWFTCFSFSFHMVSVLTSGVTVDDSRNISTRGNCADSPSALGRTTWMVWADEDV